MLSGQVDELGAVGDGIGCSPDAVVAANPSINSTLLKGTAIGACIPSTEQFWYARGAFPAFNTPLGADEGSNLRQVAVRFQLYPFSEPAPTGPRYWFRYSSVDPG